ncbi:MAG: type IV pilus twitching motility protein PilT [Thermodesulfobacteriota bacterium]
MMDRGMDMVEKFFQVAISHNANDIHLSVGAPPTLRVGGKMARLKTEPLTAKDIDQVMRALTPPRCMVDLSKSGNTDFAYSYNDHRFRIAVYRQCGTISMVLRHFRDVMFSLDELAIPEQVRSMLLSQRGLFLVTGPTGSGKTTTLASLVDYINTSSSKHIITIEDPVEILHQHKKCLISHREIGTDVNSFSEGVRWSMRHDPDVIVIGEMRDLETVRIALKAAETGHLVLATLHARSASFVIPRIIAEFPANEQEFIRMQLSTALLGVINQILVPTRAEDNMTSVMEILVNTHTVASLIRQNKESQINDEIRKGRQHGMVHFEDALRDRCVQKMVGWQAAASFSREPEAFRCRMEKK